MHWKCIQLQNVSVDFNHNLHIICLVNATKRGNVIDHKLCLVGHEVPGDQTVGDISKEQNLVTVLWSCANHTRKNPATLVYIRFLYHPNYPGLFLLVLSHSWYEKLISNKDYWIPRRKKWWKLKGGLNPQPLWPIFER